MSTQYDWDKNCAVVDRLFYMQYTFWLSSAFLGGWVLKDLWFIKLNWYADRSRARIPKVQYLLILVIWPMGSNKFSCLCILS
jgi:hypothetical protein